MLHNKKDVKLCHKSIRNIGCILQCPKTLPSYLRPLCPVSNIDSGLKNWTYNCYMDEIIKTFQL